LTSDSFIKELEVYYTDNYGDSVRNMVKVFLGKYCPEAQLGHLFAEIIEAMPRRNNLGNRAPAPGIAEMKALLPAARMQLELSVKVLPSPGEDTASREDAAKFLGELHEKLSGKIIKGGVCR